MEGGGDYAGWDLWDDDSRGSLFEGERDTQRRVAAMREDRSEATRATAEDLR